MWEIAGKTKQETPKQIKRRQIDFAALACKNDELLSYVRAEIADFKKQIDENLVKDSEKLIPFIQQNEECLSMVERKERKNALLLRENYLLNNLGKSLDWLPNSQVRSLLRDYFLGLGYFYYYGYKIIPLEERKPREFKPEESTLTEVYPAGFLPEKVALYIINSSSVDSMGLTFPDTNYAFINLFAVREQFKKLKKRIPNLDYETYLKAWYLNESSHVIQNINEEKIKKVNWKDLDPRIDDPSAAKEFLSDVSSFSLLPETELHRILEHIMAYQWRVKWGYEFSELFLLEEIAKINPELKQKIIDHKEYQYSVQWNFEELEVFAWKIIDELGESWIGDIKDAYVNMWIKAKELMSAVS